MPPAATEEPAVQSNDTVTETSSETIKDLSASTETQSDVVSLATVSTAATPVTETSTQNDDSAPDTPPGYDVSYSVPGEITRITRL